MRRADTPLAEINALALLNADPDIQKAALTSGRIVDVVRNYLREHSPAIEIRDLARGISGLKTPR